MAEITCENRNPRKPIDLPAVKRMIKKVLTVLKKKDFGLNIIFVSNQRIRALNRKYLGEDKATDVIAFREDDSPVGGMREPYFLGDIAISSDKAVQNAAEYGISFKKEIARYVIHGILHLTGYEDVIQCDRAKMKREENEILEKIGTISQQHFF